MSTGVSSQKKVAVTRIGINEFLRKKFKGPKDTILDIRPICKNTYRLNFWGKKILHVNKGLTNIIVYSVFIVVKPTSKGFKVVENSDK